jgi:hypothetical protein
MKRVYCVCGNREERKYEKLSEDKCHTRCEANDLQRCGGVWVISTYKTGLTKGEL